MCAATCSLCGALGRVSPSRGGGAPMGRRFAGTSLSTNQNAPNPFDRAAGRTNRGGRRGGDPKRWFACHHNLGSSPEPPSTAPFPAHPALSQFLPVVRFGRQTRRAPPVVVRVDPAPVHVLWAHPETRPTVFVLFLLLLGVASLARPRAKVVHARGGVERASNDGFSCSPTTWAHTLMRKMLIQFPSARATAWCLLYTGVTALFRI